MTRPLWTRPDRSESDPCETLEPLISLYADGMASPDEIARVEAHLPSCPSCRQSLLWMQATRRALATRPIVLPPPDLRARIAQAIAASDAAPRPARVFTLRPAYAAAASLTFVAAVIGIGYGLHHPTPGVQSVLPPQTTVASSKTSGQPSLKSLSPNSNVVKHPFAQPRLVAQVKRTKPQAAPTLMAKTNLDSTDTPALDTQPVFEPTRSGVPDLTPRETPVVKVKPSPRVVFKKKPLVTPSQRLMASRHVSSETRESPAKANVPVANKTEVIAKVPDMSPAVPVMIAPPQIVEEQPRVAVASSSGEGHLHTADLMDAVRIYAVAHRTSVEHNLSLAGRTAVRTATVSTVALTTGTEGTEAYQPLVSSP